MGINWNIIECILCINPELNECNNSLPILVSYNVISLTSDKYWNINSLMCPILGGKTLLVLFTTPRGGKSTAVESCMIYIFILKMKPKQKSSTPIFTYGLKWFYLRLVKNQFLINNHDLQYRAAKNLFSKGTHVTQHWKTALYIFTNILEEMCTTKKSLFIYGKYFSTQSSWYWYFDLISNT